MPGIDGDNEYSLEELEAIFNEDSAEAQPQEPDVASSQAQGASENKTQNSIETTKAFAHRLREQTEKAIAEERERIAKELGYENYETLQKQKEVRMLEDKGLNPDDVAPVVNELVEERLKNDPRMKELEIYRERQLQEFAKKELEEISNLTNGEITKLEQLPKDVLDNWKTTGSLKKSYIALHGEELILKARTIPKASTSHLQNPNGAPPLPSDKRPLTKQERDIWRTFKPGISEEELNKIQVNK